MLDTERTVNDILVVDDEPHALLMFERAARRSNRHFEFAPDGTRALVLLRDRPFAGLLVDKNMPGHTGMEVLREARQRNPHCACIMMTAYPTKESILEVMRMGASDYIEKPISDPGAVVRKLEAAIVHEQALAKAEVLRLKMEVLSEKLAVNPEGQPEDVFRASCELSRSLLAHLEELTLLARSTGIRGNPKTQEALVACDKIARQLAGKVELIEYVFGHRADPPPRGT